MIGSLHEIARALGRHTPTSGGGYLVRCPVPSHGKGHGDKNPSLSIWTGDDGELAVHCFSGCTARDVYDELRRRGLIEDRDRREDMRDRTPKSTPIAKPVDRSNEIATARRRWSVSINPRNTLVETYLAGRGLELTDELAGEAIRFHPACGWQDDDGSVIKVPAMICCMRHIRTDEITAVSRRRLTPQGEKVGPPRYLGVAAGAAAKLDGDETVSHGLNICEGVETGIAGRMYSLKPMWALGSKNQIAAFPVLGGIGCLTILAEPDAEHHVEKSAHRWWEAGREVVINRSRYGKDLADAAAIRAARRVR